MLNKGLLLGLALIPLIPTCAFSVETVPENEALAIQQISQLVEESTRAEAKQGPLRRNAHAKTHGCVKAQFHVLPLPDEMRIGIFAQAREYPAWIRYSNGSRKIQDDSVGDGRGMAIKLMNIEHSSSGTHDFVMFNHPVFFVRNAADYVEFQKALAEDSLTRFFFPDLNPRNFRLHELKIVAMIQSKKINNPLHTQYWSATPYRFGDTAMKFSARPCDKIAYSLSRDDRSPDYLRENMQKHLDHEDACFNFMVQLRKHSLEMPIEDPTVEWNEKDSPFIPVAKIIIPSQAFNTTEQLNFCEDLTFTPGHTTLEHQPLGGINRVRKVVYETSSRIRHELNGIERNEPSSF